MLFMHCSVSLLFKTPLEILKASVNYSPLYRGGPPTTSRFAPRNVGSLDRVNIGPPTRTRVTPGNPVSVGNTIVG